MLADVTEEVVDLAWLLGASFSHIKRSANSNGGPLGKSSSAGS